MKCLHLSLFDGKARRKGLFQRIPESSVFGQPIVQMRSCGETGGSHISDNLLLPDPHPFSDPGAETGKMTITGRIAIPVAEDHLVPESTVPPARDDGSICDGPNRSAGWSRIIHAQMRPRFLPGWDVSWPG